MNNDLFKEKYKEEINEISGIFNSLMSDKKIRKIYNNHLKNKDFIYKLNYNKIDKISNYQKEVLNGKFYFNNDKISEYNNDLKTIFC